MGPEKGPWHLQVCFHEGAARKPQVLRCGGKVHGGGHRVENPRNRGDSCLGDHRGGVRGPNEHLSMADESASRNFTLGGEKFLGREETSNAPEKLDEEPPF